MAPSNFGVSPGYSPSVLRGGTSRTADTVAVSERLLTVQSRKINMRNIGLPILEYMPIESTTHANLSTSHSSMSTYCSRDMQQSALIARPMTRECRLVGRLLDVKLLSDLPRAGHVLQSALDHRKTELVSTICAQRSAMHDSSSVYIAKWTAAVR